MKLHRHLSGYILFCQNFFPPNAILTSHLTRTSAEAKNQKRQHLIKTTGTLILWFFPNNYLVAGNFIEVCSNLYMTEMNYFQTETRSPTELPYFRSKWRKNELQKLHQNILTKRPSTLDVTELRKRKPKRIAVLGSFRLSCCLYEQNESLNFIYLCTFYKLLSINTLLEETKQKFLRRQDFEGWKNSNHITLLSFFRTVKDLTPVTKTKILQSKHFYKKISKMCWSIPPERNWPSRKTSSQFCTTFLVFSEPSDCIQLTKIEVSETRYLVE